MKIDLIMTKDVEIFIDNANQNMQGGELIVPIEKWNEYIIKNSRIPDAQTPPHVRSGDYVITMRDDFRGLICSLRDTHLQIIRLTKQECPVKSGLYFAAKIEPKKEAPKHDIFDVGQRQPGSFRSRS